jgi:hypothetical protein
VDRAYNPKSHGRRTMGRRCVPYKGEGRLSEHMRGEVFALDMSHGVLRRDHLALPLIRCELRPNAVDYESGRRAFDFAPDPDGLALSMQTMSPGPAVTMPSLVDTHRRPSRTVTASSTAIVSVRDCPGP